MQADCLINGVASTQIPVDDRGLQYGDGVFETIAVVEGEPLLWEAHMGRLDKGCQRLGLASPDSGLLADEARQLCSGASRAVLKILITRGSGGRGYMPPIDASPRRILRILPWPDYSQEHYSLGIRLKLCDTRLGSNPQLAGIKHTNRLEQILARAEFTTDEADEGLMRGQDGRIIEGTMSNLFARFGEQVVTPVIDDCGIEGVMRRVIIEQLVSTDYAVSEAVLSLEELLQADEVLMSNALIGIWPVREIQAPQGRYPLHIRALYSELKTRLQDAGVAWMPDA